MKLSIMITNYNYGRFLEQAVTSVYQNQSLDAFEVLLVDDGSTDHSLEVIRKLRKQFPSIRFFSHSQNLGQKAAFETLYPHLQGEYVHPLAADDVMLPGSIDLMLHYFKDFPHVPAFCSLNSHFSKANPDPIVQISKTLDCETFHYFTPQAVYRLFARTDFWIPGHTIFAKKDIYLKYTPFDENLKFINDWWVNHQLVLKEGVGYIPQPITAQRKHPSSFSASPSLKLKRSVWLYLLHLIESQPEEYQLLYKTGIFRMFGLRAIYKDLLFKPNYWKYLGPICLKMVKKQLSEILPINVDRYWVRRVGRME